MRGDARTELAPELARARFHTGGTVWDNYVRGVGMVLAATSPEDEFRTWYTPLAGSLNQSSDVALAWCFDLTGDRALQAG